MQEDNPKEKSDHDHTELTDNFSVAKQLHQGFCLADVIVEPDLGVIIRNNERHHLAPKAMEILVFLAAQNCEIVSREQILAFGWGDLSASKNNITHIVSEIRHVLDDHKECPTFIQTIPRKGYRMMVAATEKPELGLFGFAKQANSTLATSAGKYKLPISIFVFIILSSIYFLSGHLITNIEQTEELPAPQHTIKKLNVVKNAVAVLSYQSTSPLIPNYMISGLQEELINFISTNPEFQVASLRAINSLNIDANIDDIKDRLGVHYILEGKAKLENETIVINSRLIDTTSGFQVWGVETRGEKERAFDIYQQLSRKVISALHLLVPDEHIASNNSNNMPTLSFEAYDAYLQGKAEYRKSKSISNLTAAQTLLMQALELDPKFNQASAALCVTYMELYQLTDNPEQYKLGVNVCELTATNQSMGYEAYLALGKLNMINGSHNKAIHNLERARSLNPESSESITSLARVYFDLEDNNKAETLYEQAINIEPTYWRNYYQFGIYYYSTGQYQQALRQFNMAILLNNNVALAYNALGGTHFLLMQWEQASIAWSKALSIEPTALTFSNLGTSLFFLQQFDDAADIYQQSTRLTPDDNIVWANLGDAYKYSENQKGKSIFAYKEALRLGLEKEIINPLDVNLQSQLARYYSELQQCDTADSYQQVILNQSPNDPYIYYGLALVAINCDRKAEAELMINKAIKLGYPKALLLADPQFIAYKEQLSLNKEGE
ncbi:tetratricopeptide repeat protein [Thalassotalea sp. ND16A]|uniref:tetratricopeptide repeat protein n=1 Tax=Thalassotalea sp. ND16A TaxID=1535422 RepID=UPI00051A29A8|nr:tetratricopeptide repeat protein [Thalassotalea sp. ND16A]KGJ91097.1 putative transcriptional regulator, CadC [Thalassotalea sp. ND16A]